MNIDPHEIAKFAELSKTWWDPEGESRALHDINDCRGEFIKQLPLNGKKILDVGCGGGILSEYLAREGAEVIGIDASAELIKIATEHANQSRLAIDYRETTIEAFATTHSQSFDIVTCMEMLEHVPDPQSIIRGISACLRPSGSAFFSTINRTPKSYALGVVAAEYILKLLPAGTHDYKSFIRPSELAHWCRSAGLSVEVQRGIKYNPFSHSARLVSDLGVNYIVKTAPFSAQDLPQGLSVSSSQDVPIDSVGRHAR